MQGTRGYRLYSGGITVYRECCITSRKEITSQIADYPVKYKDEESETGSRSRTEAMCEVIIF
jgi:hypothetical protein